MLEVLQFLDLLKFQMLSKNTYSFLYKAHFFKAKVAHRCYCIIIMDHSLVIISTGIINIIMVSFSTQFHLNRYKQKKQKKM